ncbi:MAG: hypothetical protein AAF378_24595 [Cyanobacteria bacterium P01_A01_bin.84]
MSTSASIVIPTTIGVNSINRYETEIKRAYISYIYMNATFSSLSKDLPLYDNNKLVLNTFTSSSEYKYFPERKTLGSKFQKESNIHTGLHPSFSEDTWLEATDTNSHYLYLRGHWYVSAITLANEFLHDDNFVQFSKLIIAERLTVGAYQVFNGLKFYSIETALICLEKAGINF